MMDYIYFMLIINFVRLMLNTRQLHKLLRAISHPLYAKERVFLIREEDTAIEVMILNMSPHQFSMFVKMAFMDSYRVDCNLVNCIHNCNR